MNVTHEEIVNLMQSRFPKEFEICVWLSRTRRRCSRLLSCLPHNLRNRPSSGTFLP